MPESVSKTVSAPRRTVRSKWVIRLMYGFLMVAFPVVTTLTGIRLVATEAFLQFEYSRPGFPADRYGFTQEERLDYAPYAIQYLLSDRGISYLGQLTFEDGLPLFTERELRHMEDVKQVSQTAFRLHLVVGLLYLACMLSLVRQRATRVILRRGLSNGGVFTIALIVTLVVLIFANWDYFFETFHAIFFAGDSWLFRTSDTLIRLFPEQFWFDAALTIGGFTLLASLGALGGVWYWERHRLIDVNLDQGGTTSDPAPELLGLSSDDTGR